MKTKQFILLGLLSLVMGCTPDVSESISDVSQSSDAISATPSASEDSSSASSGSNSSSTSSGSSSESTSSSEPGSSSSEETPSFFTDLGEIREFVLNQNWTPNAQGVATSNYYAKFTAQLLTLQDYSTTQKGYNGRYKAFVANETGYVTVNILEASYDKIDEYKEDQQVYTFEGYLGTYNGEVEVDMAKAKLISDYQEGVVLDYDLTTFALEGGPLYDLHQRVKNRKFNVKGINWSTDIYKYRLKYVAKIEPAVLLFSDGNHTVQIHSHSKFSNGLTIGNVYDVYGREGLYKFRPEIEAIAIKSTTEQIELDYASISKPLTSTNLYKEKYVSDDDKAYATNMRYASLFDSFYYFEGYVNYYNDGYYNFVFDDFEKNTTYRTKENAYNAKAMFANNDNSVNVSQSRLHLSPFYDFFGYDEDGVLPKIGFYFIPYEYNTHGYWLVQIMESTIVRVN